MRTLTLNLAFGRQHRWRQLALSLCAFCATFLVLGALSVWTLIAAEQARVDSRMPVLAAQGTPGRVIVQGRDDQWDDQQYPVIWIESASELPPVLPPGLARFPRPGEAAVSPKLDWLAQRFPDLAQRYPKRFVIGPDGLRTPDELIAYVVPKPGGTLQNSRNALRVDAFGKRPDVRLGPPIAQDDPVNRTQLGMALSGLLVLPALVCLAIGTSAGSPARRHRFQILHWIGASDRRLASIAAAETSLVAATGAVAACLLWMVWVPRVTEIPLLGHPVAAGDLKPDTVPILAATTAMVAFAAVLAATGPVQGARSRHAGGRPGLRRSLASPLLAVPLAVAAIDLVIGVLLGGYYGKLARVAGVGVMPVAATMTAPHALRYTGRLLGRSRSVLVFLLGRRLGWDPQSVGRAFLGVVAITALAMGAGGYYALLRHIEPTTAHGTPHATVTWLDPQRGDLEGLRRALPDELVVGVTFSERGLVMESSCPVLQRTMSALLCDGDDPSALSQADSRQFWGVVPPEVPVRFAEFAGIGNSAMVLSSGIQPALDVRVRNAAMSQLTAPTVQTPASDRKHPSPLVSWLSAGLAVSTSALVLATAVLCTDRLLTARRENRQILLLGASAQTNRLLDTLSFTVPYSLTAALGGVVGLGTCIYITSISGAPMPWSLLSFILAAVVLAGLFGSIATLAVALRRPMWLLFRD